MKFTPTSFAALSSDFAISTKSSVVLHAALPTSAIGVTLIRLFTIGIPYSFSISFPVDTRFFASVVILLYTFSQTFSTELSMQSNKLIPIVMVRTSSFSCVIILLVSFTSNIFIIGIYLFLVCEL